MKIINRLISGLLSAFVALGAQAQDYTFEVQDASGEPVADALVMLEGSLSAADGLDEAVVDQVSQAFVPRVLAVPRGTTVDFPNSDNIRHHVYSFSPAKTFELKLYEARPENPVVFDEPGIVVLGCNIHDQMIGYIAVTDTPHYGLTDEDGRVQIDGAGQQNSVRIWHERLSLDQHQLSELDLPEADEDGIRRLEIELEGNTLSTEPEKKSPGFGNDRFREYGD